MSKSTVTYWNPLLPENGRTWQPICGLEGMAEELTLSLDEETGEYTRLTRFHPGADTGAFGGKRHSYPEEVFIVSGRLYDEAFDLWLELGHYASRLRIPRHSATESTVIRPPIPRAFGRGGRSEATMAF